MKTGTFVENEEEEQPEESEETEPEETLVDKFKKKIDKLITEIKNKNIGNDEASITVYENSGEALKTTIETKEYRIEIVSTFGENGEVYLDFNKEVFGIEDNTDTIEVEKRENALYLSRVQKKNGETNRAKERAIQNGRQETNTRIDYDIGVSKIELKIIDNKEIVNGFDEVQELNDDNCVILNDLTDDEYTEVKEILNDKGIEEMQNLSEVIDLDSILNIPYELKVMQEKISVNNMVTLTTSDISRFNAQFEIYQGQNVNLDSVKNLLDIIKGNLDTVEVLSDTEIKLNIVKDTKNQELVDKVLEIVSSDKNKNKLYAVNYEYDENTQIIKSITLQMLE